MSQTPVTRATIEDAAARISGHARVTPVMRLGASGANGTGKSQKDFHEGFSIQWYQRKSDGRQLPKKRHSFVQVGNAIIVEAY